jgi:hypothetical protein
VRRAALIIVAAAFASLCSFGAEERIWLDAKVNGTPAKIFLDTGAGAFYLFRSGAERLGFELPDAGKTPWRMYWGDRCTLECPGFKGRLRPVITEQPAYLPVGDIDGFVGWRTIHDNVVRFDAAADRVEFLKDVPAEAKTWTKLSARMKGSGILALEIPKEKSLIIIDTGSMMGIGLPLKKWSEWKIAHPDRGVTLAAASMPSAGIFVREQAWARGIAVGELLVTDVSIEEADPWSKSIGRERLAATFGLGALKRVDLVVDGKNGVAYITPKKTPDGPPNHNRLGAVFIPRAESGDALIAVVLDKTPASEAGIRNGDILLKVDGRDMTHWRETIGALAGGRMANFWERPAGMRLQLTLQRGGETIETQATLRDLLGP